MILTLKRKILTNKSTIGDLYLDGAWNCVTLEDRVREVAGRPVAEWKIPSVTAIPYGTYEIITNFSDRFGREMPLLVDVPGYTGVRMHPGNTDIDTDGCILVGSTAGPDVIYNSRETFSLLFLILKREIAKSKVKLVIELAEGANDNRS
jgi:hypothetical protein